MIKGQCLCGQIRYEYADKIEQSICCFCKDCQLAQGSWGGWNSPIHAAQFKITQGESLLKAYFHTPNKARVFCSICASPLYSYRLDLQEVIRLRLGTVIEGDLPAPKKLFYIAQQPQYLHIQHATEDNEIHC